MKSKIVCFQVTVTTVVTLLDESVRGQNSQVNLHTSAILLLVRASTVKLI